MTFNPGGDPFRLRVGLTTESATSGEFELYLKKNSGSYAAITTSSTGGVKAYDASSDADDTAVRVPRLYPFSPDWQLSGAVIDLDFANNRIYPGGAFTDHLSISRASDGYARDSSGTWVQFTSDTLRITDRGLLVEESRTNYLLNSGTPVTQTTASLATGDYTLWVEGSGSALASGGTATITGASSATDGSPDTFSVTVAGTVTVTVTGTLSRFQLEQGIFPSSYIPTTATAAVRASDAISIIGNAGTIIAADSDQSVVIDARTYSVLDLGGGARPGPIIKSVPTGGQRLAVNNDNQVYSHLPTLADVVATAGSGLWSTGNKAAYGMNSSGVSVVMGGGTVATNASHDAQGTPTLGGNVSGGGSWFGYFRRITICDSKLSDAALQGYTAL